MLIEFRVKNYRSFGEEQVFSMESEGKKGFFQETPFKKFPYTTHVVGFYGANASGKSNIFEALTTMQRFIVFGFMRHTPNKPLKQDPFCLSSDTLNSSTVFGIKFLHNQKIYDYEFHYTKERIIFEKLEFLQVDKKKSQRWSKILERSYNEQKQKYDYMPADLNSDWRIKTRDNALSLSTAAFLDNEEAKEIFDWFHEKFNVTDDNRFGKGFTIKKSDTHKTEIQSLIQKADVGIIDYEIIEKMIDEKNYNFPEDMPEEFKEKIMDMDRRDVTFIHQSKDGHNKIEYKQQSLGTKIFFGLSGILLEVLEKGEVLCIDEIDSNLHPHLVSEIIYLFQNHKTNPKNAQLIFSAHNTYFMNVLEQEQIWFTQKDEFGQTEIYPLSQYKLTKNDDYIKQYHLGVFGAVPQLQGFDND